MHLEGVIEETSDYCNVHYVYQFEPFRMHFPGHMRATRHTYHIFINLRVQITIFFFVVYVVMMSVSGSELPNRRPAEFCGRHCIDSYINFTVIIIIAQYDPKKHSTITHKSIQHPCIFLR